MVTAREPSKSFSHWRFKRSQRYMLSIFGSCIRTSHQRLARPWNVSWSQCLNLPSVRNLLLRQKLERRFGAIPSELPRGVAIPLQKENGYRWQRSNIRGTTVSRFMHTRQVARSRPPEMHHRPTAETPETRAISFCSWQAYNRPRQCTSLHCKTLSWVRLWATWSLHPPQEGIKSET